METEDTNYIYKNELVRACFQHEMAYGDFKDLERRTQSDKVLKNKASMVYKFFDKKSKGAGIKEIKNQLMNFISHS